MKKALMAAALLVAVTSASAATVSVYGVVDMGVSVSKKSAATGDNRRDLQMKSGILWERESSLWVSGDFGKVTAGRVGYLKGGVGSTALLNSYRVNPFGSQMSNFVTGFKAYTTGTSWYCNNGIVYETPGMAGMVHYF